MLSMVSHKVSSTKHYQCWGTYELPRDVFPRHSTDILTREHKSLNQSPGEASHKWPVNDANRSPADGKGHHQMLWEPISQFITQRPIRCVALCRGLLGKKQFILAPMQPSFKSSWVPLWWITFAWVRSACPLIFASFVKNSEISVKHFSFTWLLL